MRIAAIHGDDGKIFGVVENESFMPLLVDGAPARDLRQVIAVSSESSAPKTGAPISLDTGKLAAPVGPLAKNVVCVGKNYHEHAKEFARSGVDQSGDKQERTEWHRITFFGRLAEIVGEYVRKGSQIYVEGSIRTEKWQDKNGQDRYTTKIIANEMQMLGGKGGSGGSASFNQGASAPSSQPAMASAADDFDDDIPF